MNYRKILSLKWGPNTAAVQAIVDRIPTLTQEQKDKLNRRSQTDARRACVEKVLARDGGCVTKVGLDVRESLYTQPVVDEM
jgi:hypothetical protein